MFYTFYVQKQTDSAKRKFGDTVQRFIWSLNLDLTSELLLPISISHVQLPSNKNLIPLSMHVSLYRAPPWKARPPNAPDSPGSAALLITPVSRASSCREPALASWQRRTACVLSECEMRNCST